MINHFSKKTLFTLALGGLLFSFTPNASAIIVSGAVLDGMFASDAYDAGGVFQQLTPPIGNVGQNNHQSPNLFGFNEDQNILVPSPITMDIYNPSVLGSNIIPTGSTVASHYIFFDPGPTMRVKGYVEFDAVVIGILTSRDNMIATDFLVADSANYLSPGLRGLESGDRVSIDPINQKRINIERFAASNPGDYIRVLTDFSPGGAATTVPEPSTMILTFMGIAGTFFIKKVKSR